MWNSGSRNKIIKLILFLLAAILMVILSIAIGSVNISLPAMIKVIAGADTSSNEAKIILFVRLPRILSAILAGSALAVSGAVLQTILGNPVVSPGIIGINAGSGLFYLLASLFMPAAFFVKPVFAFAGALLAGLLVYFIGSRAGSSKLAIVLSGIAVTSLLTAFSDTLITIFPDIQLNRTAFMIGGLGGASMQSVKFSSGYIAAGLTASIIFSHELNILSLGDEAAGSLGQKTGRIRFFYMAAASLLAAGAVSIAGLIGFVGLIIPHITRLVIGHDNRWLIPSSAVLGAAFLLFCDLLALTIFTPYELPVGILLSFAGAPFFIVLIIKHRRRLSL